MKPKGFTINQQSFRMSQQQSGRWVLTATEKPKYKTQQPINPIASNQLTHLNFRAFDLGLNRNGKLEGSLDNLIALLLDACGQGKIQLQGADARPNTQPPMKAYLSHLKKFLSRSQMSQVLVLMQV